MDLSNYKIQGDTSRALTMVCRACKDAVHDAHLPGQPSVTRILEAATKHEWDHHRVQSVVVPMNLPAVFKSVGYIGEDELLQPIAPEPATVVDEDTEDCLVLEQVPA